jgi:acyl-CoA thioesterase FadM
MLGYLMRTVPVLLRAQLGQDGRLVSRLQRRVWPHEIDLNRHMNQAVYAQIMELGRADWLLRSGAWGRWRAMGFNPIVAEQTLVYRRELGPLARYTLDTRAVRVEGRLLCFEHHALLGDRVAARGVVKLLFVGAQGVLPPESVPALCEGLLAQPLPITDWRVMEQAA